MPTSNDFLIATEVLNFLMDNQKMKYNQAEMYNDANKMAQATKLIDKILTVKCNLIDNFPRD
jgi:ABC-type xylose transport system substrate-binding protein